MIIFAFGGRGALPAKSLAAMKRTLLLTALSAILLFSCEEPSVEPVLPSSGTDGETSTGTGETPTGTEETPADGGLGSYSVLKSYIDYSRHPGFRFGVAMGYSEYSGNKDMNAIAAGNFDNVTPGNEMKYGSVVKNDGSMDFSTVKAFIAKARGDALDVYGHNIAWHSQQNVTYLSGLLSDIRLDGGGNAEVTTELVSNPDCEGEDMSSYIMRIYGGGFTAPEIVAPGADGTGHAIMVPAADSVEYAWDNQFFLTSSVALSKGEEYSLSMKIRADKPATVDLQAHASAGNYLYWNIAGGTMSFTPEWQEFSYSGTVPDGADGMKTIAWNLSKSAPANNYYFDDIHWTVTRAYSGSRPQTAEEKRDTLIYAMDRWVKGMMQACGGYVTAWDVVNEPIAGSGDDGYGNYPLQHGSDATNFFWQDYMGDELYVRKAVELTRKYFAEYGGDPSALRLFVNDYNLEGDWDGNRKCTSLVNWVKKWEADGVTVIDGIGTQMHVSASTNSTVQASREAAVEKMFHILAASGKLIKITELDVGITDASGSAIKIANVTQEQLEAISSYYNFIINKYFEIIPPQQQFGITIWSPLDSTSPYWRYNEPIGLWFTDYKRKPAYGGVADALKANLQ
mgnify:FL=1